MNESTSRGIDDRATRERARGRHPNQHAGAERRAAIAAFIEEHLGEHGIAPTRQEIAVGVRSTPATTYHHINIMLREGRLQDHGGHRGLMTA